MIFTAASNRSAVQFRRPRSRSERNAAEILSRLASIRTDIDFDSRKSRIWSPALRLSISDVVLIGVFIVAVSAYETTIAMSAYIATKIFCDF